MTIKLWQIFSIVLWLAICLGFGTASEIEWPTRLGVPFIATAIALTFARRIFPRPPIREHLENDQQLQRLSDVIVLGIPAALLFFLGFSFTTRSPLFGLILSTGVSAWYIVWVYGFRTSFEE